MKYALFWSGGKDSLLALDRAQRFGLKICRLVNLYEGNSGRVRFHGVRKELIAQQAKALGLELLQRKTHPASFEEAFLGVLQKLREEGFDGIVFGNIHLADIRAWYEQRTTVHGFQHIEPLWGCSPSNLVREFIDRGHQARIVSVYLTCGRSEWIGRDISEGFVAELEQIENVDVCGERGEYHSFAFGGPMFRTPLKLQNLWQVEMENHLILDIDLAEDGLVAGIG